MSAIVNLTIPPWGHTLSGATLRNITDTNGNATRVELAPQSLFSGDPEFDSTSLSAWTKANSGNASTFNANTTRQSCLWIVTNTNVDWGGAAQNGPFLYQSVTGDFDIYAHVMAGLGQNYNYAPLIAQDPTTTNSFIGGGVIHYADGTGPGNNAVRYLLRSSVAGIGTDTVSAMTAGETDIGGTVFQRLKRASSVFSLYRSYDGSTWTQIGSNTTRSDLSSTLRLGIATVNANTANLTAIGCDFLRNWPPYSTASPTSLYILDSGFAGTVWTMSAFVPVGTGTYMEFAPYSQIGFGTTKYQYGASDSSPPSLNGSYLTASAMQSESNPTGRYFKLQVQYNSATGVDLAQFVGAQIQATVSPFPTPSWFEG